MTNVYLGRAAAAGRKAEDEPEEVLREGMRVNQQIDEAVPPWAQGPYYLWEMELLAAIRGSLNQRRLVLMLAPFLPNTATQRALYRIAGLRQVLPEKTTVEQLQTRLAASRGEPTYVESGKYLPSGVGLLGLVTGSTGFGPLVIAATEPPWPYSVPSPCETATYHVIRIGLGDK